MHDGFHNQVVFKYYCGANVVVITIRVRFEQLKPVFVFIPRSTGFKQIMQHVLSNLAFFHSFSGMISYVNISIETPVQSVFSLVCIHS